MTKICMAGLKIGTTVKGLIPADDAFRLRTIHKSYHVLSRQQEYSGDA